MYLHYNVTVSMKNNPRLYSILFCSCYFTAAITYISAVPIQY